MDPITVSFIAALAYGSANFGAAVLPAYIRPELGFGWQVSKDMGDGTWYQQGSPNYTRRMNGAAYLAGVTGEVWRSGNASLRYHLDYVYYGGMNAGCECVSDADYNPQTHEIRDPQSHPAMNPFHGQGHVQGVPLTLDAGYDFGPVRVGIEAGMWIYWATWHESAILDGVPVDASHVTVPQLGYVTGLRFDYGPASLSWRYYNVRQRWNPFPGTVTGTNMITLTYRY